jgi:hypothetical protein
VSWVTLGVTNRRGPLDPIMVDAESLAPIPTETVALVAGPLRVAVGIATGLPWIADDLLQCPSQQSRPSADMLRRNMCG